VSGWLRFGCILHSVVEPCLIFSVCRLWLGVWLIVFDYWLCVVVGMLVVLLIAFWVWFCWVGELVVVIMLFTGLVLSGCCGHFVCYVLCFSHCWGFCLMVVVVYDVVIGLSVSCWGDVCAVV